MKKSYLFAGLVLLAASPGFAQTKIGAAGAPDGSAMLEVTSGAANNKGLLLPKMTTVQRNAITSPATGLMIYNTTTNETQVNTGTPALPVWAASTATATGWNTTGNTGTTPATNFIGTTDNQPLSLRTNNTEKVRVTETGDVGIGTNAPAAKLHLDTGGLRISNGVTALANPAIEVINNGGGPGNNDNIVISSFGSNTQPSIGTQSYRGTFSAPQNSQAGDNIGNFFFNAYVNGAIANANVMRGTYLGNGTTNKSRLDFLTSNATQMTIDSSGFVGIGTTAPATKLQVTDAGDVAIRVSTSTAGGKLSFNLGNNNHGIVRNLTSSGGGANDVALYTSTGPTTPASLYLVANPTATDSLSLGQFVLKNTGRVGIGIIDPEAKLHVEGTARITGSSGTATTIAGRNATGDVSNIAVGAGLSLTGGTLTATAGGNNWGLTGNTGTTPAANFIGTSDNQPLVVRTNNTEKLRVTADGYVGIGIDTPTTKLQVADTGDVAIRAISNTGNRTFFNLGNRNHGITRNLISSGGLVNDVALYTASGPGSALAGSLYLAASPTATDSLNLTQFVLKNNGNIGIGTNAPTAKLHVNDGNITITNNGPVSSSALSIISDNGGGLNPDNVSITSYGTSNALLGFSIARGTAAAPLNSQAGDNTGQITFGPRISGAFSAITTISSAYLGDGTTNKSRLAFRTSNTVAMVIDSSRFVGIGTGNPTSKLHVDTGGLTISNGTTALANPAIQVINDGGGFGNNDNIVINSFGASTQPSIGTQSSRGTFSAPQNSQAGDNIGNFFFNSRVNGAVANSNVIRGVYLGNGTTNKSRLHFLASNTLAMTIDSSGYVGIGTTSPNYALHVIGDINASANVRANGVALTSDARLKRNITNSSYGLNTVMDLRPVVYDKKNSIQETDYNRHEIGFIAQEIAKVLPSLVTEGKDADKTLAVSYT